MAVSLQAPVGIDAQLTIAAHQEDQRRRGLLRGGSLDQHPLLYPRTSRQVQYADRLGESVRRRKRDGNRKQPVFHDVIPHRSLFLALVSIQRLNFAKLTPS